jgi:hypothetical protein
MKEEGVGYGRPPKATRFKPGASGNPAGRPKKAKNLREQLLDELNSIVQFTEGSRRIEITKAQAIVKTLVKSAIEGNLRATTIALSCINIVDADETQPIVQSSHDHELFENFVDREIRRRQAISKTELQTKE